MSGLTLESAPGNSADGDSSSAPATDLIRPSRFFWICIPYAVYIGFVTNGEVSLLLRRAGMHVDAVANAIALLGIPSSIYFLWSPLVDVWMQRRKWYVLSTMGSAAALALGSYFLYHNIVAAVWFYFIGLLLCMMISSAYGGLIASMLTPASRSQAAAWVQASNLGVGALLPGLILYLALHLRPGLWIPLGAAICALPLVAVFKLREPPHVPSASPLAHLSAVLAELKDTCLTPRNSFGLLLLLAPPGAGALIGLLPAISPDYSVAGSSVVWINGICGGLLMALGCLAGVWVPSHIDRRVAYASAGALNAVPALYLAFAPATAAQYVAGSSIYLFTIGFTSSLSMDLVLDIVGAVGRSGSLRFSILTALSYTPTAYMTWLEGRAAHSYGFRSVPAVEAISSVADLPLVALWLLWMHRR